MSKDRLNRANVKDLISSYFYSRGIHQSQLRSSENFIKKDFYDISLQNMSSSSGVKNDH